MGRIIGAHAPRDHRARLIAPVRKIRFAPSVAPDEG
jgi:hypothetical protein